MEHDFSKVTEQIERLVRESPRRNLASALVQEIDCRHDPHKKWVVDGPEGGVQLVDVPVPPRVVEAGSLVAVADLSLFYKAKGFEKQAVFVNQDGVELVLDEDSRRERVKFEFKATEAWDALVSLAEDDGWLTHREIIDLLRVKINAPTAPTNLVQTLRSLKFSAGGQGEATIKTGKESIAKSTLMEMSGASGDIPEDVELTVSVYSNVRIADELLKHQVQLDLATNVGEAKFKLRPKAGELERCVDHAIDTVIEQIKVLLPGMPVFSGRTN